MIRLGINTMVWTGKFTTADLGLLDLIRNIGFDHAEFGIFDFSDVPVDGIRAALHANGLSATVASALPGEMSLLSDDAAVRARTVDWIANAVDVIARFGATSLVGPFYSPVGHLPGTRRTAAEWNNCVESLRAVADKIKGSGVRIAVEPLNRFETYFLNLHADALRLANEVDRPEIGVLYDTFHANIEEKDLLDALIPLAPKLYHVHLCENDRGVPGSGHIPFQHVVHALQQIEYDGPAVVESFASTIPEIARAAAIWRDFAPTPEAFARETLHRLRPLLPKC
jgi:D-psicose/D-tagatose/L-ribulose 3-epimerase